MYHIGLDIGGTKIIGALFNSEDEIVKTIKKKTKAREGVEVIFSQISKVIDGLVENIDKDEITSIGAGVPGIIDSENGIIVFSPNIPWNNYNLKNEIETKYGISCYIGNDVNVGVMGEWKYGSGIGYKNIVGIFVGTGIGGGLVLDGKMFEGKIGAAGEIGHINVIEDGPVCGCGARGCLEAVASKTAMQNEIIAQLKRGRESLLKDMISQTGEIIKSEQIKQAFEANDELAVSIIESSARHIGRAAASIINILNPEIIIFGGGVIESMEDVFLPLIKKSAKKYSMPKLYETCEMISAKLGDNAGLYGALTLAKTGDK